MSKVRAQKSPSPIKTVTIVILVTLSMTFLGAYATKRAITNRLQDLFNSQADQIANTYYNKLHTHVTILEGMRGLYDATGSFSQKGLTSYLTSLDLNSIDKAGVSSYFYIPAIKNTNRLSFENTVKKESNVPDVYKTYKIHPETTRTYLYPMTYGYPLAGRESVIGLDYGSVKERLDAIEYARDHNSLATTMPLTFQTTGKPGFFFFLPLYTPGLPIDRTPTRQAAFAGVVGASFRSESAFEQIFGGSDPYPYLDFQIYQGDADTPDRLLHDHDESFTGTSPCFNATRKIRIQDQTWTIEVQSKPDFSLGNIEERLPLIVTVSGLIMTILLTLYSLYNLAKIYRRH